MRVLGDVDRAEELRWRACDCVLQLLSQTQRDALTEKGDAAVVGLFKQGGTGDPVLNAAWANFQALKFSDAAVQQQHSAMTRRQYTRTVKCWLARAHGGWGNCATKRKRTQLLSEAEKIDAATILATPGTQGDGSRYWRSVADALMHCKRRQRLKNLLQKSGLSDEQFVNMLLADVSDILTYGVLDRKDQLCALTMRKRKACAAQWRGERPWLVKDGRVVRAFDIASDALHLAAPGCEYIYWHILGPWAFRKIVFQYDAITTDSSEGDTGKELGFKHRQIAYAPEYGTARQSVGSLDNAMVYCVINADLGLITEPSVMHYGSSRTVPKEDENKNKKKKKKKQRAAGDSVYHKADFPSWCAVTSPNTRAHRHTTCCHKL